MCVCVCVCVSVCVCVCARARLLHVVIFSTHIDLYIMCELLVKLNNSLCLDAHCVCSVMFVERFEPQGRRFRNFRHYYFPGAGSRKPRMETDNDAEFKTR